jgi:hypothetical protein
VIRQAVPIDTLFAQRFPLVFDLFVRPVSVEIRLSAELSRCHLS